MKKIIGFGLIFSLLLLLPLSSLDLPQPSSNFVESEQELLLEPTVQAWAPNADELWSYDPATGSAILVHDVYAQFGINAHEFWDEEICSPYEAINFVPLASFANLDNELSTDVVEQVVPVSLRNNEHFRESQRLKVLSEEAFEYGDYDAAANYAAEAAQAARRSDEYVALHLLMRSANDAIYEANSRLNWASSVGAEKTYADRYSAAQGAYVQAINNRADGLWYEALSEAQKVLSLLSDVRETLPLPAFYVVRPWATNRDCFWNIAKYSFVYNDPFKWQRLYQANRTKLLQPDNPDLIQPGLVLSIPSIGEEYREGTYVPGRAYPALGK